MSELSICLNMIVKNEAHIIQETLEMLTSKIIFSYWVICDTGSTDNTCEIIQEFFNNKNIPGELHKHEWKDFAHNRTLALENAFNKTDLLFVFDADDEIHGIIDMPKSLDYDGYHLNFGSKLGVSYQRILLINNRIKWIYKSVIHEYIECSKENPKFSVINGDYYIVSGKKGSRNLDENKYLNDAKILEKAYHEAISIDDELYLRYGFYCANSYKDAGMTNESIKWYKIVLTNNNWYQEKYMACYNLYWAYLKLNQIENGIYYLIESIKYDEERIECIYELIKHYFSKNDIKLCYKYYLFIKNYYENNYLNSNKIDGKLFIQPDKGNFYFPFHMILIAHKMKDFNDVNHDELNKVIVKMYEIVFKTKIIGVECVFIGNMLFNLQFFIDFCVNVNSQFINLLQSYIDFLDQKNVINLSTYEHFMIKFEKYGLKIKKNEINESYFSKEECEKSNKILVYTGDIGLLWNHTYSLINSLGGSETAVSSIVKYFPKEYEIYISGSVIDEDIENIHYIHLSKLDNFIRENPFHIVVVSRFVEFYEKYSYISFYKSFIWVHDCNLQPVPNMDVQYLLNKWDKKIDGAICQTNWHKEYFVNNYKSLTNKTHIINNGISFDKFLFKPIKVLNRFVYTSRPERGLERLLELWPEISNTLHDAELYISTYVNFPRNQQEQKLKEKIDSFNNIKYLGCLNKTELYKMMSTCEFWLYPTCFYETSCITAMEMLMSEVICIYYPLAGLVDTIGNYGISVKKGNEIDTILNLTVSNINILRNNGKKYALTCSWEERAKTWNKLLNIEKENKKNWIFFYNSLNFPKMIKDYILNLNKLFKEYNIHFTDDVQYILDIQPDKLTYVHSIFNKHIQLELTNTKFSYLNTEPLNIPLRLNYLLNIFKDNDNIEYYDYSKSNIQILNEKGIDTTNFNYLPYICTDEELSMLNQLNSKTKKIYDFGLILALGGDVTERRQNVVTFLTNKGFTVNIISGWGIDRDQELAKCKCILNIHGFCDIPSAIFEHIRCDRLLESKFNILSEISMHLDSDFIKKYENLKLINYNDFFDYNMINEYLKNLI
jgi:hypothetical protein